MFLKLSFIILLTTVIIATKGNLMEENCSGPSPKADFNKKIEEAGNKIVVIYFFANWCGPCKRFAPKFEELAGIHDSVVFVKVDIDKCEALLFEHSIRGVPALKFMKGGQKIETIFSTNEHTIEEIIENNQ